MSTILIKKEWTRAEVLAAHEAGGKKRGRIAGGWVDEIAAQKRVITLCPLCTGKFNPGRVGYRKEKEFPYVQAKCDGCSTHDTKCSMYIYAPLYSMVRSTAEERRALNIDRAKRIKQGYL
jgi:hypothetical protein